MMKKITVILFVLMLTILSVTAADAVGALPEVNDQPRHVTCTVLSDAAQAYYTGDHTYENLSTLSGAQDISTGYTAMQDNELFTVLHALMAQSHAYYTTYSGDKPGSLAYFWNSTDAVSSSGTYMMFYSDVLPGTDGIKLNREHVWPKSRASFGEKNGGADLHHLRPSADTLNRAKSDHTFGDVNGVYDTGVTSGAVGGTVCYWVMKQNDLFECKDDVKGDVARILLYVYCRWEQPNLFTDVPADLLPAGESDSKSNSGKKVVESLDTLLSWCQEDPVDTWEMRRNDLVESVQGNRNVFIDYPELAWQLFSKEAPSDMPTPTSQSSDYIIGDADGDSEITILDAAAILRVLADVPTSAYHEKAADADGDHTVPVFDATCIQRWIVQLSAPDRIGTLA